MYTDIVISKDDIILECTAELDVVNKTLTETENYILFCG